MSNTLWVFRTCSPAHLSTRQPGLTGPDVNIGLQDIMANLYIFTCRSVNLSCCPVYFPAVLLSRLYMEYSFYCGGLGGLSPRRRTVPFSLCHTGLPGVTGPAQVAKYEIPIMSCPPIFISRSVTSCRQVDRAPGGNIGDLSLMGIPYLSACQPVPRVDRSICKYIGFLVLMGILFGTFSPVDLSTCQPVPGLTGPEVNI